MTHDSTYLTRDGKRNPNRKHVARSADAQGDAHIREEAHVRAREVVLRWKPAGPTANIVIYRKELSIAALRTIELSDDAQVCEDAHVREEVLAPEDADMALLLFATGG